MTTILQGAAVLGGVLLALAADASWDYRVDRVQEREYLEAFRVDFAGNAVRIDSVLEFHRSSSASLRRLISVIDSAGTAQISNDSIEWLVRPLYVLIPFDPILASLDDLVQSGSLNLIRDDTLRTALAEFRRALEANELSDEYAEEFWRSEMVAVFRDDIMMRDLPGIEARLGPSTFRTDMPALLRSREFENRVVLRWALGEDMRYTTRALKQVIELINRRLDVLLSP